MRPSARVLAGFICLNVLTVGCMLPTYHLPAGYSSTYRDRLMQQSAIMSESVSPTEVGSTKADASSPDAGESRRGFFYPSAIRVSPEQQQTRYTSGGTAPATSAWGGPKTD